MLQSCGNYLGRWITYKLELNFTVFILIIIKIQTTDTKSTYFI